MSEDNKLIKEERFPAIGQTVWVDVEACDLDLGIRRTYHCKGMIVRFHDYGGAFGADPVVQLCTPFSFGGIKYSEITMVDRTQISYTP